MRLPATILLALLVCVQGRAATVYFDIADFQLSPSAYRALKLTPESTPTVGGTNQMIVNTPRRQVLSQYGRATFSNVVAGTYTVLFEGNPGVKDSTSWSITVTNTSDTINGALISSVSTNLPAAINAYSMAASDARYLQAVQTNGVSIGTNPHVNIIVGSNMVVVATNNTTESRTDIHISSTATAGGGGEANTSSNTGDGVGIANAKSGVDLPFKSFKSANDLIGIATNGTNITFTGDTTPELVGLTTSSGATNTGTYQKLGATTALRWGTGALDVTLTNDGAAGYLVAMPSDGSAGFLNFKGGTILGTGSLVASSNATVSQVIMNAGDMPGLWLAAVSRIQFSDGVASGFKDLGMYRAGVRLVGLDGGQGSPSAPTGSLLASNASFVASVTGETFTATSATVGSLTASRPMLSSAAKALVSGQIDLSSSDHVTGTLAATRTPTNTASQAGVVTPGVASKVWKTDGSGNPDWRDDATGAAGLTPWTSDINADGYKLTNTTLVNLNKGTITATATNLAGDVVDFLMLGHAVGTFTPTNTAMVNLVTPTGSDWVWPPKTFSVIVTGVTAGLVHSLTFRNAVMDNTLVLNPGTTNRFDVYYDGITNRVRSWQELTTGSGAVVLSNAPTILNATLTGTPVIAGYPTFSHLVDSNYITTANISDTAMASSWNGVTTIAPSKNAVHDWVVSHDVDFDGLPDVVDATVSAGGVERWNHASNSDTWSSTNLYGLAAIYANDYLRSIGRNNMPGRLQVFETNAFYHWEIRAPHNMTNKIVWIGPTNVPPAGATNVVVIGNTFSGGTNFIHLGYAQDNAGAGVNVTNVWEFAFGETNVLATGTELFKWRAPYAMTVVGVRASLSTASSSGIPTVDINESGTTIISTKLTIDANETTSTTAAAAAVISDSAIADDAEMTFDIDVAGTGAAGLKVKIYTTRP